MSDASVPAVPTGARGARFNPGTGWLWSCAGFLLVFVIWQAGVALSGLPEVVLPAPSAVFAKMFELRWLMLQHGLVTLREILIGFALSILVGFPIALAIAFSRPLSRLMMPVLIVSNAIPKVAIAPLFLIWFGFGQTTNATMALLTAVFPVVLNTALGLAHIDPDLLRLGRIMGGSSLRVFVYIRLPSALPSIFAGLKLSMTLATIGAIVGELVAGQAGLGYLSQFSASQLQTVTTFACIVALAMLGIALFYLIVGIERLVLRERAAQDS